MAGASAYIEKSRAINVFSKTYVKNAPHFFFAAET